MANILSKLKLDNHHKIERFGVVVLSLALALLIVTGTTVGSWYRVQHRKLGSQAIYTTEFKTSRTGVGGNVEQIFRNNDQTAVFVLMKFGSMANISSDAKNYQIFLTGKSSAGHTEKLICAPSGVLYIFGSTGYFGVYLKDVNGFQPQLVDMTIRHNSSLVTGEYGNAQDDDESFKYYDQFKVLFNPGGTDAVVSDSLAQGELVVRDMYENMITREKEHAYKIALNEDLEAMQKTLGLIEEYEDRLVRDKIVVPDAPRVIRGDKIEGPSMEDGSYELISSTAVTGAYDFDWKNGSIKEGYSDVTDDVVKAAAYLNEKDAERKSDEAKAEFSISGLKWYLQGEDGLVPFENQSVEGVDSTGLIQNDISNLMKAWSTYYSQKVKYQVTDMRPLLVLEINAKDGWQNYTLNDSIDLITLY